MFEKEVILYLRGYLPVIYPLLFVGILWFSDKKIKNSIIRLGIPVGTSLAAASAMAFLCYCCNIMFGVDNPIYKDPLYSMIACSAIVVLYIAHTQSDRNKPGYAFKWIFTILGVGIFAAAYKPLCQMAWFIDHLHIE